MPNTSAGSTGVNVPGLGHVPKGAAFAGLLAVGGVGVYLLYKHTQTKHSSASSYAYGYGTSGNAAGYGYGGTSPAQSYYGYGFGYGAYGYGMYSPYGGYFGGNGNGPPPYSYGYGSPPVAPTTNVQWLRDAVKALGGRGMAPLTRYMGGLPLTMSQADTVREATGLVGPPPVDGPHGYPPRMHIGSPHHIRQQHHKHHSGTGGPPHRGA